MSESQKAVRDRNLLFGVIAVQLHFIKPADLGKASVRWAAEQEKDLGVILMEMDLLDEEKQAVIAQLLDLQIKEHGDASKSLQAFGGERTVHESFAASITVKDDGVECTLCYDEDGEPECPEPKLEVYGGSGASDNSGPKVGERLEDAEHITLEHPGRYTIKHEHGRGGIGRVLVAFDEHIGRDVALKELIQDGNGQKISRRSQDETAARFLNEAKITGRLEHPGIVPVHEIGRRVDESYYYTMKLIKGRTLGEKIQSCRNLEERLQLLPYYLNICQAVGYAHSQGVIHRDLKPSNIIIGHFGETIVLDWGLAKQRSIEERKSKEIADVINRVQDEKYHNILFSRTRLTPDEILQSNIKKFSDVLENYMTMKGVPLGTPAYMSPEQAQGRLEEIAETSDVWSLGVILYEILAGQPPFEGENVYEMMSNVINGEMKPPDEIEPDIPDELASITTKCLSMPISQRYEHAGNLAQDVLAFLTKKKVSAHDYSPEEHRTKLSNLKKTIIKLVAFLCTLMVGIALGRSCI